MHSFDRNNEEAFLYLNHFSYYSEMDRYAFSWYDTKELPNLKVNIHNKESLFGYQFQLIIIIFSFIGIPPLPGFGAKYIIFYNLFMNHNYTIVFFTLIVSLISAYYYFNLIYKMFNKNETTSYLINQEFFKFVPSLEASTLNLYIFLVFLFSSFNTG